MPSVALSQLDLAPVEFGLRTVRLISDLKLA
jgi:hypothetical protein